MTVGLMVVLVIATGPMLVSMLFLMVRFMVVSVIVLASRTVLVMFLFGTLFVALGAVVAMFAMLVGVFVAVMLSTTAKVESGFGDRKREEGRSGDVESLGGQDAQEADGCSQHQLLL
jgi:hypothetical protein